MIILTGELISYSEKFQKQKKKKKKKIDNEKSFYT